MKENKLILCFLFLLIAISLACNHYNEYGPDTGSPIFSKGTKYNSAKSFFESKNVSANRKDVKNAVFPNGKSIPIWSEGRRVRVGDDFNLLVVNMPEPKIASDKYKYLRRAVFYEYKSKVIDGYIIELIGAPEMMEKFKDIAVDNFNKDIIPGFTGVILVNDLQDKYMASRVFENGKLTGAEVKLAVERKVERNNTTGKVKRAGNTLMNDDERVCLHYYYVWTYRDDNGNIIDQTYQYLYTVCDDVEGLPGGSAEVYMDCYGTVNGSAYIAECGCIGGETGIPFCPKDPCLEKLQLALNASNSFNLANKNFLIDKAGTATKEWGAEQNLSSIGGSFMSISPSSTGSSNTFGPAFSWNPITGYTIGVGHSHPSNTGPSPKDVLWMWENTEMSNSLKNSGNMDYYKANISVTTYLADGRAFIVTVNDWTALETEYKRYIQNENAYNSIFRTNGQTYLGQAQNGDEGLAAVWALKQSFKDSISIYVSEQGSNNLVPLRISTSDRFALEEVNCN